MILKFYNIIYNIIILIYLNGKYREAFKNYFKNNSFKKRSSILFVGLVIIAEKKKIYRENINSYLDN